LNHLKELYGKVNAFDSYAFAVEEKAYVGTDAEAAKH